MKFFLLIFVFYFPSLLKAWVINQPVVNIYLSAEEDSEVNTQAIYGTSVEILENNDKFTKIKMSDGEEGWVESYKLINNPSFENSQDLRSIKNLFANVYRVEDITVFPPLITLPYGSKIKILNLTGKWVEIELACGKKAYIKSGDIEFEPELKNLAELITFSKKFLGLPYYWGGTSTYGFDCSGYIQMLFKEMGYKLPRNAKDQVQSDLLVPIEQEELETGDLIFFGENKVTHVGLYLGNGEYIHSGVRGDAPIIKINNLTNNLYTFFAARRIKVLP